jgi:hypothetical protein
MNSSSNINNSNSPTIKAVLPPKLPAVVTLTSVLTPKLPAVVTLTSVLTPKLPAVVTLTSVLTPQLPAVLALPVAWRADSAQVYNTFIYIYI